MTQPFRTPAGGVVIDRSVEIRFTFDGRAHTGHPGDTLVSALLANGIHTVGRSLKHRRPRGIHGAGAEEPNALVTVGRGARRMPNLKATEVVLTDGLVASSQRGWPGVRRDLGTLNGFLGPFLPPGFYYKTFMRPRRLWPSVEQVLRRAAASARPASEADPDRYEKRHLHTDALVVGAGPAGLSAAAGAAAAGRRVILAESDRRAGGCLLDDEISVGGGPATEWVAAQVDLLDRNEHATLLTRCTVFGRYAGGRSGAVHETPEGPGTQRYLQIQASRGVLATGAIERPLLLSGNDRPRVMLSGNDRPRVMLASAAQRYATATACGPASAPWCPPTTTRRPRRPTRCAPAASRSRP
ncbi:MAG: 2Fe-2S iron-sulfur cluster-binding protein [Acidimicrobiales bacterium]